MADEIKVEYLIDKKNMSDEEYENQEEKVFIITEDMIIDLMHSYGIDCDYNHLEDSIDIIRVSRK